MEWRPAGWSVCLPLLISPCAIKSRSSLLAPAHLGGPGKRAVKGCGGGGKAMAFTTNRNRFQFCSIINIHRQSDCMRWLHQSSTPAGRSSSTLLSQPRANVLHQTCIAGLVKYSSLYTVCILEWISLAPSLFACRKQTTEHCSLWDAFNDSDTTLCI